MSIQRRIYEQNLGVNEAVKVGDTVHIGHGTKGGTGVTGKVTKVSGGMVHIQNDKGDTFKGPVDRVTVKESAQVKRSSAGDRTTPGTAGQNPLITAFGGDKEMKNAPSYKRYQERLKAEREARARRVAAATQAGLKAKQQKQESVELDEYVNRWRRKSREGFTFKNKNKPKTTDKAPEPKSKELPKNMRSEAIKYDSAGDSTGTVTGKGKRDRGPGGTVMVKYKGSETYPKGARLPIKARDMGRLLKQARKSGTTPYDSRNLRNPRLTKDHVELEGLDLSEMNFLGKDKKFGREFYEKDGQLHVKKPGGTYVQNLGSVDVPANKKMMKGLVKDSNESFDKLTPAQERDAQRRLKPTRATVAKVRLRATDNEIADKVKKWQSEKGGNPGNTKNRRKRDIGLRDRLRDHVELDELKMPKRDASGRIKSDKVRAAYRKGAEKAFTKGMAHDKTANVKLSRAGDALNKAIANDDRKGVDAASRDIKSAEKHHDKSARAFKRMNKRDKTSNESVELDEVSPPGFEGTVKAMKKRHKDKIDNPWALAWWMKNKGYKSHKKPDGSPKEGQ